MKHDRKHNDSILREARRLTKWNKRRLNKMARRQKSFPTGKCGYKKTSYCAMLHTMA